MRSDNEQQKQADSSPHRELRLLMEINSNPEVTQRDLAKRAGIALGLTNALLRNLAQKGYLRASQASWKRWLYNLTPEGLSHKIRLTVAYVQRFLSHYQQVRQILREEMEPLILNEESRVAIYGTGEFAELVYLGLKEIGIEEIEMFGPNAQASQKFLGMPVHELSRLNVDQYDRVLIADLVRVDAALEELGRRGEPLENVVTFLANGKARGEG